jgi:hypothetical protein
VIAEQQAPLRRVDRDEVDDEVLGRRVGRDRTEELRAGRHPVKDAGLVGGFPAIEWLYVSYQLYNS